MLTLDMVREAQEALRGIARRTPLDRAPKFGENVYIKAENLQLTGAFKLRGAYNKIRSLTPEEAARGVIACSAGNHAQGIALSASRLGIKAVICMPAGAPISKVEATRGYGAEVVLVPGVYDDAAAEAERLTKEQGYTFAHPFNDPLVIAGQGTIGLEILDELEDPDAVVVPIGGGGLISGVAYAIKHLNPKVKVYGVQAAGAASMVESQKAGEPIMLDRADTFADGIAVKHPGDLTYELVKEYVDEIVTVTEDEISTAILALLEKQKVIAEGAGAVGVAAVLFHKLPVQGKKVVCIVSGGNIDVNILSRVITRGLVTSGRNVSLTLSLADKPGQLQEVADIISHCGGNVVSVHHDRSDANMSITSCFLKLGLETRDREQIAQIKKELTEAGFHLVSERV